MRSALRKALAILAHFHGALAMLAFVAAFALGVLTAVGALALMGRLDD